MRSSKFFLICSALVFGILAVPLQTPGKDPAGRLIYTNSGANLKVTNTDRGTITGWGVYCFARDNNQLAQLRGEQKVTFEATVQGREEGSSNLVPVDAVLK